MAILGEEGFAAGNNHTGHTHDKIGFLFGGQHQCDRAAFAVTEDAYTVEALAQQRKTGRSVILQVLCRAVHDITGRFAEAPVIVAECSNPLPGQIVCDDGERLVLIERLVTVLQAAAGNH